MNYFALAGAILSAVLALNSLAMIAIALGGKRRFKHPLAFPLHAVLVAAFGAAAIAWFNVAAG